MNFCVIGAGAWGTAFSLHLLRLGHSVTLVPRRFEQALDLSSARTNEDYLPGYALPNTLQIGHELTPVLLEAEVVLLACPSHALRSWCEQLADHSRGAENLKLLVSLSKGLEKATHRRPTEILAEVVPGYLYGALSGPTNAAEVAAGRPTAMVLALGGEDPFADEVQAAVSGPTLRVYRSRDALGVELGGCLKNVYAIAAGCCDGLGLGDNSRAAMLTRALAEMVRLGVALGARAETFYGLSGFGDLVATCHGTWSRNRDFGLRIGRGEAVDAILGHRRTVVEGFRTTESFYGLCRDRGLDAPILEQVYAILYEGRQPADAISALMTRELKHE